jgi:hypothetical protein
MEQQKYLFTFSICTLITQWDEYELMKSTFQEKGFADDSEFLNVDNSKGNVADAYHAIRYFLNHAKGKYIVIVHQDVRCIDTKETLMSCLNHLNKLDDKWAICGNAGAKGYHQDIMYINTSGRIDISENLPCKVSSLDENLLIIKAEKRLTISDDISGFHFYGTDLCFIADFLGYSSYVIPFMVKHLSSGNLKDLELHRKPFIKKYGRKLRARYIQTPCTKFYAGGSELSNSICNKPFFFFLIKFWERLKYNSTLMTKGNLHRKKVSKENDL